MSESSLPPFKPAIFRLLLKTLRATRAVSEYLDAHATILEWASRLEEKAGTPSESARNRAERARGEVVAGLAALRSSFVEAAGRDGGLAFDRAVGLPCPAFIPYRP